MKSIFANHFFSPTANLLMLKPLFQSKKIIIHGLASPFLLLYLYLFPSLARKSYWAIWGKDLYFYRTLENKYFYHTIYEFFRKKVIKEIRHIITHMDGDYDLAKEWYGSKAKHHKCFMYPSNLYKDLAVKEKHGGPIVILLGNSADPSNNHFEAFSLLKKFRCRDIKIITPLSYGDRKYANRVKEAGLNIFGDKFKPIEHLLPLPEYLELLRDVDIGLFAHKRQQAMGNITTLLGMGKKICIRNDITTWRLFNDLKVEVCNFSDFNLTPLTTETKKKNRAIIKSTFSEKKLLKQWNLIIE